MARLTPHRLQLLEPLLEEFRQEWIRRGSYDTRAFEERIQSTLGVHYKDAQEVVEELARHPRYTLIALYCMEFGQTAPGVPAEFKAALEAAYGVDDCDSPEGAAARVSFWDRLGTAEARQRAADFQP